MTAVASPSTTAMLAGLSIVLPCHDEEANVAAAVRMACRAGKMNALVYEVIVVDDGSRDGTNAVATRLAACLLYTSPSPRDLSTSRMPSSA